MDLTVDQFEEKATKLAQDLLKYRLSGRLRAVHKPTSISKLSLGRIRKKLDLKTVNAEKTTETRAKSVASKWNSIAFAAANWLMVPKSSPEIIFNSDATSINVGKNINEKVKVVRQGKRTKDVQLKVA